jgi:DNA-directed RNA polymerase subunit M/transcription elongation factor TFIIS
MTIKVYFEPAKPPSDKITCPKCNNDTKAYSQSGTNENNEVYTCISCWNCYHSEHINCKHEEKDRIV